MRKAPVSVSEPTATDVTPSARDEALARCLIQKLEEEGRLLPPRTSDRIPVTADIPPVLTSSSSVQGARGPVDHLLMESSEESSEDEFPNATGNGEPSSAQGYSFVSSSLSVGVPPKLKRKILKGEYINLADLLSPSDQSESPSLQLKEDKGKSFRIIASPKQKEVQNIDQWTDAFLIFSTILMEREPSQGIGLMRYMKSIRDMARKSQAGAWRDYDEKFRREMNDHKLGWHQTHWNLYMEVLCLSSQNSKAMKPAFRGQQKPTKRSRFQPGQCYTFELHGKCAKQGCRFNHSCSSCGERHQSRLCAGTPQQKESNTTGPKRANTHSAQKAR